MIKVVIADDEDRICRLIQVLVDWEAMGMEIVGTASNGIEALQLIRSEEPDILISDIRMPGCNGLELIAKVSELCPRIKMVIISGYAHFEYAQTAVKYGVSDYLLKPIDKEELTGTLAKLKLRITEEREKEENTEQIRENHEKDVLRLRSLLIRDLIEKPDMQFTEEMLEKQYHLKGQPGYWQIFILKMDYPPQKINENAIQVAEEKLESVFGNGLTKHCSEWILVRYNGCVYGVMNYGVKQGTEIRKILRSCLNQMEAQKNLLGTIAFTLGLGVAVKDAGELGRSMQTAGLAVEERLAEGTGRLLECEEKTSTLSEQKLLDRYRRSMEHALEVFDLEELRAAEAGLAEAVRGTSGVHGWEILELVRAAASMFVMRLDIRDKAVLLERFDAKCEACSSGNEVFEVFCTFEEQLMKQLLDEREKDSARPIRLAKQYIQNHYSEQITLEEVSAAVGLSAAYFSTLFKKETEVGFAKYLMNVRMEQAKILLRESNLSVTEICRKVGYNDIKHFTHTFEKTAGVKPAVYRKLYG